VQVRLRHVLRDAAPQALAKAGHGPHGAAQGPVLRVLSRRRGHVRRLVALRARGADGQGGQLQPVRLVLLDQARRRRHRLHGRRRFHVHSVQDVCSAMQSVEAV